MKQWYCVPHTGEVDEYEVEGNLTDFPRGVLLAYGNCCLTTGFKTKEEAIQWMKENPCKKQKSK
jgi:hypothetical protein